MNTSSSRITPMTTKRRRIGATFSVLALGLALGMSACSTDDTAEAPVTENAGAPVTDAAAQATADDAAVLARAALADVDGQPRGEVAFTEADGSLVVSVSAEGMDPGFYGLHVHEIGECVADSAAPDDPSDTGAFESAGSHIPGDGADHPEHAGDLPPLLVGQDGTATMTVSTDRLDEALLLDADGAAVMIHSKPDNFANIPERYAPDGPDDDTTGAGDAGDRLACGVVEGSVPPTAG
ncbi:superoxide dismutase [Arthrobacter echini]|uniref:Superoxide dismutase [Cu-Zn] n=1 Tax=Arthrobacter echini TaxID=1529066 RepID=A0A4S5E3V9_9MICC|nr:superoxide dismutase family protein [Arthrobacter echini]THJ66070.1 superoxide dismutase [Arthrobacter echini]